MSRFEDFRVDVDTEHIHQTVDKAMRGLNRELREMKRGFEDFHMIDTDHIHQTVEDAMKSLDRAMRDLPFGAECGSRHRRHERHEHRERSSASRGDELGNEADDTTRSVLKALERGDISVDDAMEQLGER